MKIKILIPLSCLLASSSCLKEDTGESVDLEAPVISAGEGLSIVRPDYFLNVASDATEIPLAFTVSDETGIREIKIGSHSGFDGHTHGKSPTGKNPKFIFFSHSEVIGEDAMENPTRFTGNSEQGPKIYLDDRNPTIGTDDRILAGPYHFSIQATDTEGNETKYQDNSTYHTTLFINRPYAPQVEISNLDSSAGSLSGRIFRNDAHEASSDIVFLWIYIEALNAGSPGQEGEVVKERIWGSSNWPHQSRPDEGEALPDARQLDFGELLGGDADFNGALKNNTLVIWAEDANGNISISKHAAP